MAELNFQRRDAASGTATSAVIFVHGYGADGADLLGLAEPLAQHMPETAFFAPDAPERSMANPAGFQWFPIPWLDGSTEAAASEGMERSARLLDAFVDRVLAEEGLDAEQLILFGFSQGTMMSLHIAPRREEPVAGIVGVSGRLLRPEALGGEAVSKPPVMLIHGDADEVVPFESMRDAADALMQADFTVYGHVMQGTGHGIAPDGLGAALAFMQEVLGLR